MPTFREGKVMRVDAVAGGARRALERLRAHQRSTAIRTNDLPLLERATDPVATNPVAGARGAWRAQRGWRILRLFE